MSKFKSIKQQQAEKVIDAMFASLPDDINLRTALEVMYGLRPESDLDELRRINEENYQMINQKLELTTDASGNLIEAVEKKSNDIINGSD